MTEIPVRRDRRIARTQQLLSTALMQLVVERGFDDITVQDITDRADVSRATFYLHYRDKDELLFASMEKIYDSLVTRHHSPTSGNSNPISEAVYCDPGDFEHVAEYADFYRAMLSKKGSVSFVLRVMDYLAQVMQTFLEAEAKPAGSDAQDEPRIPVDLIAAFCAGAEIGVMKWWLENDMRYSAEEMAQMQFMLSSQGLRWALGHESEKG